MILFNYFFFRDNFLVKFYYFYKNFHTPKKVIICYEDKQDKFLEIKIMYKNADSKAQDHKYHITSPSPV